MPRNVSFTNCYVSLKGAKIANFVSKNLHKVVTEREEYKCGNYESALIRGFLEIDERMRHEESLIDDMSGSTAIVALLKDEKIFVANVGDSR